VADFGIAHVHNTYTERKKERKKKERKKIKIKQIPCFAGGLYLVWPRLIVLCHIPKKSLNVLLNK
jgi:hypothetical protein